MLLKSIKINKFKRLQDLRISISDINIFVGQNGSGKSSVLQAVHFAACLIRQAKDFKESSSTTVSVNETDYLPTSEYPSLYFNGKWGNRRESPRSRVDFEFEDDAGVHASYVEMRSARNEGISVRGRVASPLVSMMRSKGRHLTAYTSGISGVPIFEEKQSDRVVLRNCSFGNSNSFLRNALEIVSKDSSKIAKLERWMSNIVGQTRIFVKFDQRRDFHISVEIEWSNRRFPLELSGTGFLQIIQIFAYILLFSPRILLIDEPDTHLNPEIQQRLIGVLREVAQEVGIRVLVTTHSPFIVRGAPIDSNIFWLVEGGVSTTDREAIEQALGWGAFGKRVLLFTEDKNPFLLRKIISQWPNLDRQVAIIPGSGYANIPTADECKEIFSSLHETFDIIVHRDGDSLTANERQMISDSYAEKGFSIWIPTINDIESYYCDTRVISKITGTDAARSQQLLDEALRKCSQTAKDMFAKQRKAHQKELYDEGGSPHNDQAWAEVSQSPLSGAKGKTIFRKIKDISDNNCFNEHSIVENEYEFEIAPDLRALLEAKLG